MPPSPALEPTDDSAGKERTGSPSEPWLRPLEETREENAPGAVLDSDDFVESGLLGRGGSSLVVRALDKGLLRDVAVKVLSSHLPEGSREAARFTKEARIAGQLEHPNIVPVYGLGAQPTGQHFLCMRVLEGCTLAETLSRAGAARLEADRLADFLQVFVKVCDAMAFAHSRGVLHRDLKPSNIMTSDFGQVYVLDWGIALLLPGEAGRDPSVRVSLEGAPLQGADPAGVMIGTPGYMAPEQFRGDLGELDARTDIFALGGTLYEILTGQPPLSVPIIRSFCARRPPPPIVPPEQLAPAVPPELARIAMRALAYDPSERYPSVAELKCEVENFQRGAWHLPRLSLPPGTVIAEEGDRGHAAYVIERGRCTAYRMEGSTEVELRVMGPGEVFGETAVFCDTPRTASVKALTDVSLLVVTSEVLAQAVGLNSWVGVFVKALAARFRETEERLRALERCDRDSSHGERIHDTPPWDTSAGDLDR